jgi:hypothetical protein
VNTHRHSSMRAGRGSAPPLLATFATLGLLALPSLLTVWLPEWCAALEYHRTEISLGALDTGPSLLGPRSLSRSRRRLSRTRQQADLGYSRRRRPLDTRRALAGATGDGALPGALGPRFRSLRLGGHLALANRTTAGTAPGDVGHRPRPAGVRRQGRLRARDSDRGFCRCGGCRFRAGAVGARGRRSVRSAHGSR